MSVPEEKVAECQPRRRKRVKTTLRDAVARCTKAEGEPDSEPDFLVEYVYTNYITRSVIAVNINTFVR